MPDRGCFLPATWRSISRTASQRRLPASPGHPLGSPPRYRREGDFIIERLAKLTAGEGSDLRHIVRVDQYYPNAQVVNAYQRARKAALKDFVPPSTSVLMEELSVDGATMGYP